MIIKTIRPDPQIGGRHGWEGTGRNGPPRSAEHEALAPCFDVGDALLEATELELPSIIEGNLSVPLEVHESESGAILRVGENAGLAVPDEVALVSVGLGELDDRHRCVPPILDL